MQEQDRFKEDQQHPGQQASRNEGIHSFQEVVYPPRPAMNRGLQYLIGLGIGAIPLAMLLLSAGSALNVVASGILGQIAIYSFVFVFLGMTVCLCAPRVRFVGYGLLTMVLISPVVYFIACTITIHICGYRRTNC